MGGYGSGRRGRGKMTTEQVPKVDIRDQKGLEPWVAAFGRHDCEGPEQWIDVEWTPARFGGQRPWYVCASCRGHAMILYKVRGQWVCRRCGDLVYPSSRENNIARAVRQERKLRKRIGASCDLMERPSRGTKPKGMWWRTYERLLQRVHMAEARAVAALIAVLPPGLRSRL